MIQFERAKYFFVFTKFVISSRGPCVLNKHPDKLLKTAKLLLLFKAKIKDNLIKLKTFAFIFNNHPGDLVFYGLSAIL